MPDISNQTTYLGLESIKNLKKELSIISPKKIFLLRGKGSYHACGAKDVIEDLLTNLDIAWIEWFDFQENPKIEDVYVGVKLLDESKADVILAIGGGSVIDMSKLVRFAYSYNGDLTSNDFYKAKALIPLFALPTTSGTGCETTPFAVCYKNNAKYSIAHKDIQPDYAIIYPPFTYSNSPYLTACTGFDALAQAIEAYWNVNATEESDKFAEEAINLLWSNLPIAVNAPTPEIRNQMAIGAYLAGKAISITKTTAPHAFSYAFTTYCGYPHGHAVALTFPFFFDLNVITANVNWDNFSNKLSYSSYISKMKKLLSLLEIEEGNKMSSIQNYLQKIGLTVFNGKTEQIGNLTSKVNIQRLNNNPFVVNTMTIKRLNCFLANTQKHI